jgi:hypothetical protein
MFNRQLLSNLKHIKKINVNNVSKMIKMIHTNNKPVIRPTFNKLSFRCFSETKKEEKKEEEEEKKEEENNQNNENEDESQNVNFKTSRKIQRLIFLILKIMFYAGSLVTFLNIWVYAKYKKPSDSPLYNKYGYDIVKYVHLSCKTVTDVNILNARS